MACAGPDSGAPACLHALSLLRADALSYKVAFSLPHSTVEKRLIDEGEMQTWITRAFGGDRLVLVPTRLPLRTNASTPVLLASMQTGQDPVTKV